MWTLVHSISFVCLATCWLGHPANGFSTTAVAPSGLQADMKVTSVASGETVDVAEYLKSGFTPDYDTAGGSMVDVVENTSRLSDDDRAAIAAYLKAVPKIDGE